jgi:protein-tyrosine phosphatase
MMEQIEEWAAPAVGEPYRLAIRTRPWGGGGGQHIQQPGPRYRLWRRQIRPHGTGGPISGRGHFPVGAIRCTICCGAAGRRRLSHAGHRPSAGTEMRKTSLTYPLQIATISAGSEFGRVGITFCPEKYDRHAMSGEWNRDLALDLNTIRDWGAAAVVTLLEPKELALLRVESLGEEVLRRNMLWFHLPIVDVSIPDERFEQAWDVAGEELRSILRSGSNVLVHCRGGLGRAGTIAARLLVELGMEPATAIASVRTVRPGAIETSDQERFVLDIGTARK